ncbi:MAG: hypothetical protein P4L54_10670 [Acidocella sp.]|nr:hypothetical protein [Acidocella sp.]
MSGLIDWTEIPDGDSWELFARDFLAELGFVIDVGPGRGPDAGKDLIVSEQLRGKLRGRKFSWLVSCKHYAASDKAIGPDLESNIMDRITQHKVDGFMGFYSTMPTSGLVDRLSALEEEAKVGAWEVFDRKKIEGHFVTTGLSKLAMRYIPLSYARIRPIQKLFGQYKGMHCEICGVDVLKRSAREYADAILVWAMPKSKPNHYEKLFISCKGQCDTTLQGRLGANGFMTSWEEIQDLTNPALYLKNFLTYMNALHSRHDTYSDEAHAVMKQIYISLGQRTLREVTQDDEQRYRDLAEFGL